jgi:type VI secretion system secreted protein Hcp
MAEFKSRSLGGLVRRPLLAAALATGAVVPAAPAIAAMDIFVKLDDLAGESTDVNHKDWIEVKSYQLGVGTALGPGPGAAGKVTCAPLEIMKVVDKSSPLLFRAASQGTHYQKVQLDLQRQTPTNPDVFLTYQFQDVMVSSIGDGASRSDEAPTESVSFNFAKVTITYKQQGTTGTTATTATTNTTTGDVTCK